MKVTFWIQSHLLFAVFPTNKIGYFTILHHFKVYFVILKLFKCILWYFAKYYAKNCAKYYAKYYAKYFAKYYAKYYAKYFAKYIAK